jgi:hypothetical protein
MMERVRTWIRYLWFKLLKFFASNRTASVAIISPFLIIFLHLELTLGHNWIWLSCVVLSYILIIVAAIAPQQYAAITLLDTILPSIHKVLGLSDSDRVTIHYLRSRRKELYEQFTNYFPSRTGQGRIFPLRRGIVGRCFNSKEVLSTSLPPDKDYIDVFPKEWGYTRDEVGRLRQDRRSYFAFPISEDGEFAMAVLYMDSSNPDKFTSANKDDITEEIKSLFLPLLEQVLKKLP